MVLILALFVILGSGGASIASLQAPTAETSLGQKSLPGFVSLPHPLAPQGVPRQPLWSG